MWTRVGALLLVVAAMLVWWGGRPEHERAARERPGLAEPPPQRAPATAPRPDIAAEEPRDDPEERGPCTLRLRVVDQATGRPVASEVHLWRLDAPATERWTRGDRRVRGVAVGVDGATVEGLPEGLYRADCEARLQRDEAPPAFVVRGERTEVDLPVRLPREFVVWLRVVDEHGRPVTESCRAEEWFGWVGAESPPAWVVPGRSVATGATAQREEVSAAVFEETTMRAEGGIYRLGAMLQDRGSVRHSGEWWLWFAERTGVEVGVDGTIDADRTYVGVTVPLARIRELIRLPGGGDPDEIDIIAVANAVEEGRFALERATVDVTADLEGYEGLEFLYRVAGPNEVHVMRPE